MEEWPYFHRFTVESVGPDTHSSASIPVEAM